MAEVGVNGSEAVNHAGNAGDMADAMATLPGQFGNAISPLYSGALEITAAVVDFDIEGNERILRGARASRGLADTTVGAVGDISETDADSAAEFSNLPVVSMPRELNF